MSKKRILCEIVKSYITTPHIVECVEFNMNKNYNSVKCMCGSIQEFRLRSSFVSNQVIKPIVYAYPLLNEETNKITGYNEIDTLTRYGTKMMDDVIDKYSKQT